MDGSAKRKFRAVQTTRRATDGMSLLELLIAISIASLIILPLFLIFNVSERVTFKSINEVVASNLAMQKLEELKSRPFEQLKKIIEGHSIDPDGPFQECPLPLDKDPSWNTAGVEYEREARLSFFPYVNPDASDPEYELQKRRIRLRVIVRFSERDANNTIRQKNFEMATIVADEQYGAGFVATFTPSSP